MSKLISAALLVLGLALISLFVGISAISPRSLLTDPAAREVLLISRVPRTIALVLGGAGMATAGLIMQMLARNRFVEPSTAGTVESASLGLLAVTLFAPAATPIVKMLSATAFAVAGTVLFFAILARLPTRSTLIVPLVGIMLGGIISAVTTFFAYRFDLLQSLGAWTTGDFSGVLRGRYELLYVSAVLTLGAYVAADRFTVAGLGEAFAVNLGLNFRHILALGLAIVAMTTAVVVVSVGAIPFLGLVVPNLVSMALGDNMRRAVPWTALSGAAFVLACDIVGRTIRAPYEVPIGTVVGVVGSGIFLMLLLRRRHELG
ncbi:MAG TPA: iron chelate uptake ABC transporter family permease subunit [Aurantimonas sp.]|nr:iron chelate uptake ABC transporter family permease subunit [Aurantimonas sp.]